MMLFCLWCVRFLTHLHPEVYSTSCLPWKWKVWLDTGGMAVWTSYWKHMSTAVQTVAAAALVGWPWSTLSTAHSYRKLRPDQEPGSLLVSLPTNQKAFTKYFSGFLSLFNPFSVLGRTGLAFLDHLRWMVYQRKLKLTTLSENQDFRTTKAQFFKWTLQLLFLRADFQGNYYVIANLSNKITLRLYICEYMNIISHAKKVHPVSRF